VTRSLFLSLCLSGICLAQPALTPEEFVKLQYLSEGSARPDGALAYTVSSATPEEPHFSRQGSPSQTKVCLFENGQERVLLENAFQPSWSSNGKALALLDADIDEARLKVWWRERGNWSVLRHASLGANGGPGYVWMPNQNLLVATRVNPSVKQDVSILESQTVKAQPRQVLVEWNPDTGTTREWARGVFSHFAPSPQGERVVALRMAELDFPKSVRPAPLNQLVLLDLAGKELSIPAVSNPTADSLRWSADGQQLSARDEFGQYWVIRADTGAVTPLEGIQDCCWIGNRLAVRSDQWRLDEKVLLGPSARFFGDSSQRIAIYEGQVYQLNDSGESRSTGLLSGQGPIEVESRGWPLVLRQGEQRSLLESSGSVRTLPPLKGKMFAASGNKVWLSNPEHTRVVELESQQGPALSLPESQDRLVAIPTQGAQCDWLLLPPASQPGPYPTVVWLQPGQSYKSDSPPEEALLSNQRGGLNARLLTAQGYACYFPSLPTQAGVEPAIWLDKQVNQTLQRISNNSNLDSRRLAVMGQGLGGYATLVASTQSHNFRAAIALSPLGDLAADYARLSPATRLSPAQDALPFVHRQSHDYEKGQLSLGKPPWQDPQLWVRNSPIYQAGRVQTPVLLISGSQDGHLPQSEQFFTALYRQGKPARLVRYQDEAQSIGRADHVVDQWRQIHSWLQRYLGDESTAQSP